MFDELINEFTNQIEYSIDSGISIEIRDFYRGNENVDNFKVEICDDKKYRIIVKLKKYNIQEVKKIFSAFLNFIQYPNANFYIRINEGDETHYKLITAGENKKGFYFEIIFS